MASGDGSEQPPINVRPYSEPFADHVFGGVKVLLRRNESGETTGWQVDWSEVYGKEQPLEFNELPVFTEQDRQARQVVQAVARAGVNIHSIYDFVNYLPTPRFVVPTLLECLDYITEPAIKQGVLRALADKTARGLTEERLLKELDKTFAVTPQQTEHGVHIPCAWELAMALGVVATHRSAEPVLQVLRNRVYGGERAPYVDVFLKTKDARATEVLLELLEEDDDGVLIWVVSAIRRRKIVQALPKLRQLQSHPNKHLRKKIAQAIAKLESLGSGCKAT